MSNTVEYSTVQTPDTCAKCSGSWYDRITDEWTCSLVELYDPRADDILPNKHLTGRWGPPEWCPIENGLVQIRVKVPNEKADS